MADRFEVAFVAVTPGSELDDAVPEEFGITERGLAFEEATNPEVSPELCATAAFTHAYKWYVVLDPGCRLSASPDYAIEASKHGDVYILRFGDEPREMYYRNGKPQHVHEGADSIRRQLSQPADHIWLATWDLAKQRTGIGLEEIQDAMFTVFEVD